MQGRSIRSFALDYYRQQGADIRPLEEDAYEIVPRQGAALTVTFTGEDKEPAWVPLTATSPQWRSILEDLTTEVVVSYRYLTGGPIQSPARTLESALPEGWQVLSAKLSGVETRSGVAFTHRVTFDAPALNAREETIHTHLWDLETGERLLSLEPHLFKAPCLLFRPENLPGEATLQRLIDQSMAIVDSASDLQGEVIERELGEMLAETERRTNQYFDQQMGNVMAREVTLSEKLDGVIRRLSESKTPEQVARLRQEGEQLGQQLELLKARRELDLQAVESACAKKLEAERERHELTATTDLVALCHVRYDVVTYRASALNPAGLHVSWDLRYCPLTTDVRFPECPTCESAMASPVPVHGGGWACEACTVSCQGCGTSHVAHQHQAGECGICSAALCPRCQAECAHCQSALCLDHAAECGTCEAPMCPHCRQACAECARSLCQNHARRDAVDGLHYCDEHLKTHAQAEVVSLGAVTLIEPEVSAVENEGAEPVARSVAELQADDSIIRHAITDTCHGCEGEFRAQELVDCPTCGVPSCQACSENDLGPCPACAELSTVSLDDPLLAFALHTHPQLKKGLRRWSASRLGPYVVTCWRRMGWWGMVVYHDGGAEPVLLNAFAQGPLDTLRMSFDEWFGGKR